MKNNRSGQAAALTEKQLDKLLSVAPSPAYRALWSVQRWCAARVGESLQLRWVDVAGGHVTFRRTTTKTATVKQLPQSERLQQELERYRQAWATKQGREPGPQDYLFPGRLPGTSLTTAAADLALRKTTEGLGWVGVSTHSFRRSTAQAMLRQGASLPQIQVATGHATLSALGEYLKPSKESVLAFLEHC